MKLYHAGVSSCSQKVRLVLAAKGLAYEAQALNLAAGDQFTQEYLALNPNAVVPTLVDADAVIIESSLINEYLDEAYPGIPLAPSDPVERHHMRLWCKRFDALHSDCGVLTYAIGVRPGLLQRPAEEVEKLIDAIPDSARREQRRAVVADGVNSTHFSAAIAAHIALFGELNVRLQHNDWLAGEAFSLADASLTPYVLRVDHLQIPQLLDANAALASWYERVQLTPQFAVAITDHLPAPVIDDFKAAGEAVAEEIAKYF